MRADCRAKNRQAIEEWVALQFLFDTQWLAIKVRAASQVFPYIYP
jgi:hypothetical protein